MPHDESLTFDSVGLPRRGRLAPDESLTSDSVAPHPVLLEIGPVVVRASASVSVSAIVVSEPPERKQVQVDLTEPSWDLLTFGTGFGIGFAVGHVPGGLIGGSVMYAWGVWRRQPPK